MCDSCVATDISQYILTRDPMDEYFTFLFEPSVYPWYRQYMFIICPGLEVRTRYLFGSTVQKAFLEFLYFNLPTNIFSSDMKFWKGHNFRLFSGPKFLADRRPLIHGLKIENLVKSHFVYRARNPWVELNESKCS